jgi:antirestriction protein ArdC
MGRKVYKSRNAQDEQVELILDQLAKGVAPWAKPWQSLGSQRNAGTGRLYNGGNALYLAAVADSLGYGVPLWLTAKQANDLGGRVRGGRKGLVNGELVETQKDEYANSWPVLWFRPCSKAKTDADGQPVLDSNGEPETSTFWRRGVKFVYNVEQTTVPAKKYAKYLPQAKAEHTRNVEVEAFLDATHEGSGFGLSFGGDRAFYRPSTDDIRIPEASSFRQIEEFYAANIHEFAHATGHKSRLARGLDNTFGSTAYAEEELVAELTAAFVGAEYQIDGVCQHPQYLGSWFKALDNDKRLFYIAASKAKKAAAYLQKAAEKAKGTSEKNEEKAA